VQASVEARSTVTDRCANRPTTDRPSGFYGFFMRKRRIHMRAICGEAYRAACSKRCHAMDIAYLVFLAVLVVLTAGYIRLCAKLEDRK
jgi:hypothetical protein